MTETHIRSPRSAHESDEHLCRQVLAQVYLFILSLAVPSGKKQESLADEGGSIFDIVRRMLTEKLERLDHRLVMIVIKFLDCMESEDDFVKFGYPAGIQPFDCRNRNQFRNL